jgi:hypothetical protein
MTGPRARPDRPGFRTFTEAPPAARGGGAAGGAAAPRSVHGGRAALAGTGPGGERVRGPWPGIMAGPAAPPGRDGPCGGARPRDRGRRRRRARAQRLAAQRGALSAEGRADGFRRGCGCGCAGARVRVRGHPQRLQVDRDSDSSLPTWQGGQIARPCPRSSGRACVVAEEDHIHYKSFVGPAPAASGPGPEDRPGPDDSESEVVGDGSRSED